MYKTFGAAAVVALGVYGASELLDDGLKGCAYNGDGGIYTVADNDQLTLTRGWRLTNETQQRCVTGGGSTEPQFLPVVGFVNNAGKLELNR
jgi:hypothetical protein